MREDHKRVLARRESFFCHQNFKCRFCCCLSKISMKQRALKFTAAKPTVLWDVLETVAIPFILFSSKNSKDYCCILFPDRFYFSGSQDDFFKESFVFNELKKMLKERTRKSLCYFLLPVQNDAFGLPNLHSFV